MGALWRSRQWRKLLNLIDHLPRSSYFIEAVSVDEEWAKAQTGDPKVRAERLSEWSPEVAMMANAFDRLGNLMAVMIAVAGGKPPTITPHPRPITASQRLERQRQDADHDALVRRLTPQ